MVWWERTNYHLTKTVKLNEKGYNLIHIFEDEWLIQRFNYK